MGSLRCKRLTARASAGSACAFHVLAAPLDPALRSLGFSGLRCSWQRGRVENPVAALRRCIHQCAVLGLELWLEGVDTIMCLTAPAPTDGQDSGVMTGAVRTAQGGDAIFASGERVGSS